MDARSDSRILTAIQTLNNLLSPLGNQVVYLDFSHFLSVSSEKDDINVVTYSIRGKGDTYEMLLEKAYQETGFCKFSTSVRRHCYVRDFSKDASIPLERLPIYQRGPSRNLDKSEANVTEDTQKALEWFDYIHSAEIAGSGLVFVRGNEFIQSSIFVLLAKPIEIAPNGSVDLLNGKATHNEQRFMVLKDSVIPVLEDLLTDEMEESAFRRFRKLRRYIEFATHEIRHVDKDILASQRLEEAKALAFAYCLSLSAGLDIEEGKGLLPACTVSELIRGVKSLAQTRGMTMTITGNTDGTWERLLAFTFIEISRNAWRHKIGEQGKIEWAFDDKGGVVCHSMPHQPWLELWPFKGQPDYDSARGTHLIARLAKVSGYSTPKWTAALHTEGPHYQVRFELARHAH